MTSEKRNKKKNVTLNVIENARMKELSIEMTLTVSI